MKAAPRIPANLPAAGLGALNSKHVAGGGNNGVRMVAGGKRAGGGKVFRLGKSVGLEWLLLTPWHRGRSPPVPAVPSPLLVQSARRGWGG